uniref:Uncharacterized protein n=1 Tax=Physcomitrium patens TaxID=3218 RepID=A0A2K1LBU7_PHYPA|nr:hypothetical protein PHYPA_001918 [Physcomitrium patens]
MGRQQQQAAGSRAGRCGFKWGLVDWLGAASAAASLLLSFLPACIGGSGAAVGGAVVISCSNLPRQGVRRCGKPG